MSCPSCTFEISCWTKELAKQIIDKDNTIEVQVQNDGEDGIDDTRRGKENSNEDFPEAEPISNVDESMGYNILTYRQKCATMSREQQEAKEQEELSTGPFSVPTDSVRSGIRILVYCTNNKRLLGRLKAFNRHFNMVLVEVLEMWTEQCKGRHGGRTELVKKGRYISKMFLKGDSVILVIKMQ